MEEEERRSYHARHRYPRFCGYVVHPLKPYARAKVPMARASLYVPDVNTFRSHLHKATRVRTEDERSI